jgi:hypothetical protein
MSMGWQDLLFLHWPVAPADLARWIPRGLELETWEGRAWLGVVPFRMTGIRLRWLPPIPGTDAFPELNVRTYVRCGDRSGVWFFSLDAAHRLAVRVARAGYHLNYLDARMECAEREGWIQYRSRRTHAGAPPAEFSARYRPKGEVACSRAGSLEAWLTERYSLFAADAAGGIYRGDIEHSPWPLQAAEAVVETNSMTRGLGLELRGEPLAHFSRILDVRATRIWRVG